MPAKSIDINTTTLPSYISQILLFAAQPSRPHPPLTNDSNHPPTQSPSTSDRQSTRKKDRRKNKA